MSARPFVHVLNDLAGEFPSLRYGKSQPDDDSSLSQFGTIGPTDKADNTGTDLKISARTEQVLNNNGFRKRNVTPVVEVTPIERQMSHRHSRPPSIISRVQNYTLIGGDAKRVNELHDIFPFVSNVHRILIKAEAA